MKNTFLIFITLLISGTTINAQWMELVTPTINYEVRGFLDLEINLEGEPHLLCNCEVPNGSSSDYKLFVEKYDAANEEWTTLGGSFVNELNAFKNSMAIDSEGTVYVTFLKVGAGISTCTVTKFDGTDWITIGEWNVGVLTEVAMYCDNQDDVYISHSDSDYSGQVVKRYLGTGSGWETLGDAPYLTNSQCLGPAITTDNEGNVLVSFGGDDYGGGLPLSVKKFDGSTWEYVGTSAIGDEPVSNTSIIVGNDDIIYATTMDFWSSINTVHSFQNSAWDDQYICNGGGYMPFTKYIDDIYMGHYNSDNGLKPVIKKLDDSGIWVNLSEQPGENYTSPSIPATSFDIKADNYGNLYMTLLKGDNFNHHVSVIKLDITTGIKKPQKDGVSIYPNPTSGVLNLTGFENLLGLEITDITGKTICNTRGHVPLPLQIDLSDLRKGVYFINIFTSENNYTEKLIIN